ncbi:MAG TPA: transposase [Candidatus Kryptonia bacterium]
MMKGLRIHGYVIMPNHVHAVLSSEKAILSGIVRDHKRFTSAEISRLLLERNDQKLIRYFKVAANRAGRGNDFKVWQTGCHPVGLLSHEFFQQKLDYLHLNPVRKGFVDRPEHWLYSSARNYYLDDESIMTIDRLE